MTDLDAQKLRSLDAAATPGPWAYRPDEWDDWGIVKSPRQPVEGFEGGLRCCLAQFRHPAALDEEVLNSHRRAKTDPWQGNAELVTFLRNSVPAILAMAEESERCEKHRNDLADKITEQSIEIGALKAQIEALLPHTSHAVGCAIYQKSWALREPDCSCGLKAARALGKDKA